MSMLAKIVKNADASLAPGKLRPFSLPDLGAAGPMPSGVSDYVFPTFDRAGARGFEAAYSQLHADARHDGSSDEASGFLAEANAQMEAVERAAYEKGVADAMAAVDALVAERTRNELAAVSERLAGAIGRFEGLHDDLVQRNDSDVAKLAIAIAKKVIHREASIDPEVVLSTARAALAKLHGRSKVEIRLNPDDHEYIQNHRDKLHHRGSLETVADVSIARGGCLLHTDAGDIDATIDSQLDEIADAFLAPEPEAAVPFVEAPPAEEMHPE